MKTLRFLLATLVAVATLGFASCSKDGNSSQIGDGETAEISISLKSDGVESRATGESKTPKEEVKHYAAFAFKSDGSLDGHVFSADVAPKKFKATTGTKSVYVVANVLEANFKTAGVLNIKNLANLEAHLESLTTDNATSVVTKNNVWASGLATGNDVKFEQTGADWKATVAVTIKFAVSKVNIKITNSMINLDAADATKYKVTDLIVLNAVSQSRLFPLTIIPPTTSLMPTTLAYLAGADGFGTMPTRNTVVPFLKDAASLPAAASTADFHYYLLENDASDHATILAVVLEKTVGGVVTTRYVPVHFTGTEADKTNKESVYAGYKLVRNNQYQVNLTLVGDAEGEPGTVDPTDTIADIEVTVTLADWEPEIVINKEL